MSLILKCSTSFNKSATKITFLEETGDYDSITNVGGFGSPNRSKSNCNSTDIIIQDGDKNLYEINLDSTTTPSDDFIPKNGLILNIIPSQLTLSNSIFADGDYVIKYRSWFNITGTFTMATSNNITTITGTGSTFTSNTIGFNDTTLIKIVKSGSGTEIKTINKNTNFTNTTLVLENESELSDGTVNIYAGFETTCSALNLAGLKSCFYPKLANIKLEEKENCTCQEDLDKYVEIMLGMSVVAAQDNFAIIDESNNNIKSLNKICRSIACK